MIYLFNSAGRPEYVSNVFNTLYLPNNAGNTYQYSDKYVNVDNSNVKKGESTVIIFADIDAGKYYPLRFGKLIQVKKDSGRSYFRVSLGNYPDESFDEDRFQNELVQKFGKSLFDATRNGFLAFCGDELDSLCNLDKSNDPNNNLWTAAVNRVKDCSKLSENYVFTKFSLVNKRGKRLLPKTGTTEIFLRKNVEYKIVLNHINANYPLEYRIQETESYSSWGNENGFREHTLIVMDENKTIMPSIKYNEEAVKCCANVPISVKARKAFAIVMKVVIALLFAASLFFASILSSYSDVPADASEFQKHVLNPAVKNTALAICAIVDGLALFIYDKIK